MTFVSRPIRVLHGIQNLNYGGMERVLSDLVHGVDPARFEPHVLTLEYVGRYGRGLDEVATLHEGPRQSRISLLWPRALTATIQRIAPDVMHLHSGIWFKGARAARAAGTPTIIYTEHGRVGPEGAVARWLDHRAAAYTDHVVAVSEATADQLVEGPRLLRDRISVIRNGIDTARFAPGGSNFRDLHGIPDETTLLGSVGRLERVKGYDLLLRAMRRLVDDLADPASVHLVLAGDGSMRRDLEALRVSLGLEAQVTLLGWWDEPESLLRALDVFVLSSHSEGTSISLLEAMSSGCCPVVTRVGGNPDVLGPDLAHRLATGGDPASIAGALRQACLEPAERHADAERARARVQRSFGMGAMVEAYSRLYTGAHDPR